MKLSMFLLLSFPIFVIAQDSASSKQTNETGGIHFEQGLSWHEIKSKAKAEGKPIFMDFYATWCGPCKFMSQNIFTQKAVGDFMNENFINVAVQMDQTAKDNEEIKMWYVDAKAFGEKYSIGAYPTYIFFRSDGEPLHRMTGTSADPKDFLAKAAEALDPNKQYYAQIEKYKLHIHDSSYLKSNLMIALSNADGASAEMIANSYFECIQDKYNPESIDLIMQSTQSSKDKAFTFFLDNTSNIDKIFPGHGIEIKVSAIIVNEEVVPQFESPTSIIDWIKIKKEIKKKYPAINATILWNIYLGYENGIVIKELREPIYKISTRDIDWAAISEHIQKICPGYNPDSIITMEKPRYYSSKKMWSLSDQSTLACLKKYGNKLDPFDLNNILWDRVFMESENVELLGIAVDLAKRIVPDLLDTDTLTCATGQSFEHMDTYANLLYKAGKKDQAILWERRALKAAQCDGRFKTDQISFIITIGKMERGENTLVGRSGPFGDYK